MKVGLAVLAAIGMSGLLAAQAPTPIPAPTPVPTGNTSATNPGEAPKLQRLGSGFGMAQRAQATPIPTSAAGGQQGTLADVASKVKLRKLTPEELRQLQRSTTSPPTPTDGGADKVSPLQQQREDAMREYRATVEPLRQELAQADQECGSCAAACRGVTNGSMLMRDSNGNFYVQTVTIQNSDLPECQRCASACGPWRFKPIADAFNAARDKAAGKGVLQDEMDRGHLIYSNMKD